MQNDSCELDPPHACSWRLASLVFQQDKELATRAVGGVTHGLCVDLYKGLVAELKASRAHSRRICLQSTAAVGGLDSKGRSPRHRLAGTYTALPDWRPLDVHQCAWTSRTRLVNVMQLQCSRLLPSINMVVVICGLRHAPWMAAWTSTCRLLQYA